MPPEVDERPLFGPGGRIPTARTVTSVSQSGFTALRRGWLPRHTVAMVVLSPLLYLAYNAALQPISVDPVWTLITGAMSLVAASILATYLPLRGAGRAIGSSCAVMAGLLVPGAGMLLHQATGPLGGVLALGILSLGLLQRVTGTSACG